jgi:hypothetical protein
MLTRPATDVNFRRERKRQMVFLGLWGLRTGRSWLVKAVQWAIQRERLTHE